MSEVRLDSLPIGASFILRLDTTGREITGKVLRVTPCSVTVKVDGTGGTREFETAEGEKVRIPVSGDVQHWAGDAMVRVKEE